MMQTYSASVLAAVAALLLSHASPLRVPQEVATGEVARRVDDYLTRLVPHGFSGAVLIAQDGRIVLKKGYGLANRGAGLKYTSDLVSCIGSVTKQFTGAAILKLEMQGKLRTSDPIAKYLAGVPPDKNAITIHHLLTHTAGFAGDMGGGDEVPIPREDLIAKVLAAPLETAPGERFEYSNEGYSLAGAIVERVSGQGYEAFLREHLFLPAGMNDTGYQLPAWQEDRLPLGYGEDDRNWGRVYKRGWLPDGPGWYLRANGGIHASLDDLYRWHVALATDKVLSTDAVRKYQTGYIPTRGGGERYAYGWGVDQTRRGTTVISHNGGNGYFFTDFRRYSDENVVIIAMTNQPVIRGTELAVRQLESLVFNDRPVVIPPAGTTVSTAAREAVAGRYTLEDGSTLVVRVNDSGLVAEASDPTLFGATAFSEPGGKFADLENRTISLIQEAAKDNVRPLFEAFDDGRPFEVVQTNQRRYWKEWQDELGPFQRAEAIGTGPVQGDPAVMTRLHFAKGVKLLQFIWGPKRLLGWRAVPPARPAVLLAESPGTWAHYNYRLPHLVQLTFANRSVTVSAGTITRTGTKEAR
jgi:CubicO group peptidase (beta-lactamase class C family)